MRLVFVVVGVLGGQVDGKRWKLFCARRACGKGPKVNASEVNSM